ncbi:MAG: hypothetical protein JXR70_06990 [Spirochaetales bacterium]|nr:hypothetical protein [Spirochaetales bacterium]
MKILLKNILGYGISARDGHLGFIHDFLFDDSNWEIKYVVVNTSNFLFENLVLISPEYIRSVDYSQKQVFFDLNKSDIKKSPDADSKKTVSRQYQDYFEKKYSSAYYWYGFDIWAFPPVLSDYGKAYESVKAPMEAEKDPELAHLRSVREVIGYHIVNDYESGKIKNITADEKCWAVLDFVVEAGSFLHHHNEEIEVEMIDKISFEERAVYFKIHSLA